MPVWSIVLLGVLGMLALEYASLHDMLSVPAQAYGVEGSSMYLHLGEKLSLEDLLYGLMLVSGNDAALTIAIHIGGSVEGFARMMNTRVGQLGCRNTNFVTPNGLPDSAHYTTAYDLGLICSAAMQNAVLRKIVSAQYWQTSTGDMVRTLKNKNKLLWQYDGGNGIKTGFTKAAGRCLAFSAQREGHMLIGTLLNSPDMWNAAIAMLDYGFAAYRWEALVRAGDVKATLPVEKGVKSSLEIVAKEDILLPLTQDENVDMVQVRIDCPYILEAPVFAGQEVGMLEAWLDNRCLATTKLLAKETVLEKEYPHYLLKIVRDWAS